VLRNAAEKAAANLSDAAEKAAEVLADTAERLAQQGAEKTAEAGTVAGKKVTKASKKLAKAAKARRKTHRVRRVVLIGGAIGGVAALAMSPIGAKIKAKLTGARDDGDEPESITLPIPPQSAAAAASTPPADSDAASTDGSPKAKAPTEGNGVLAGRPVADKGEEKAKGA